MLLIGKPRRRRVSRRPYWVGRCEIHPRSLQMNRLPCFCRCFVAVKASIQSGGNTPSRERVAMLRPAAMNGCSRCVRNQRSDAPIAATRRFSLLTKMRLKHIFRGSRRSERMRLMRMIRVCFSRAIMTAQAGRRMSARTESVPKGLDSTWQWSDPVLDKGLMRVRRVKRGSVLDFTPSERPVPAQGGGLVAHLFRYTGLGRSPDLPGERRSARAPTRIRCR